MTLPVLLVLPLPVLPLPVPLLVLLPVLPPLVPPLRTLFARLLSARTSPKPLDLTVPTPLMAVPPSPAGTEFSVNSVGPGQAPSESASAAAIAAAGGPPASTVHRVQLDFKPTLEDEMELRAGQLVRLLHEYDDGWVRIPCQGSKIVLYTN